MEIPIVFFDLEACTRGDTVNMSKSIDNEKKKKDGAMGGKWIDIPLEQRTLIIQS